ncbi:MAG: M50 family metallopeptidase [Desulfurococcaceae archaeon TW002]
MSNVYVYLLGLILVEALLFTLVKTQRSLRDRLEKHRVDVGFLTILIDIGTASKLRRVVPPGSKSLKNVVFIAGVLNMALMIAYLYLTLINAVEGLFRAVSAGEVPVSPFVPVIPGITISPEMLIPLILSIGIAMVVHELMHALVALLEKVEIESWGIGLFIIFPAAYVKLSENSFNEAPRKSKASILSAGILGNSLIALLALGLISLFSAQVSLAPVIIDLDRSNPELPALQANISTPSIILEVNGSKIKNLGEFTSLLRSLINQSVVLVLKTQRCVREGYRIVETGIVETYVVRKPAGSRLGVYLSELVTPDTPEYVIEALFYTNWVFIVNLSLAIINAAPIFVSDGGRIITEILSRYSKKLNYVIQGITSVTIAILLVIGLINYI